MMVCSNLHQEIVYNGDHCPVCGVLHDGLSLCDLIKELKTEIEYLNTIIKEQSALINGLRGQNSEAHK